MKINKDFLKWFDDKEFESYFLHRIVKYAEDEEFLLQLITPEFAMVTINMIQKWDSRSIHLFVEYLKYRLNYALYQEDNSEKEAELCLLYLFIFQFTETYPQLYESRAFGVFYVEHLFALSNLVHKEYEILRTNILTE